MLLQAMVPVAFTAGGVGADLNATGSAIMVYATVVRSIKARLQGLVTEASASTIITALGGQTFAFSQGSAAWLPAPPTHGQSADLLRGDLDPTAIDPGWHGEPLDLGYATDVLLRAWHPETGATAA